MKLGCAICLSIFALQACEQINEPVDHSIYIPKAMELSEDCVWKNTELLLSETAKKSVSFRYADCGFDEAVNFHVSNNGTKVSKAFYDVVYDTFNIFERGEQPIEDLIKGLPNRVRTRGENCKPKQISERLWIIDDGLSFDAEINEMPCGDYGRNFFGQTVFEVREDIVLNYNIWRVEDGIDPSSIVLSKQPMP